LTITSNIITLLALKGKKMISGNLQNAINLFNLGQKVYDIKEIKAIYRRLASANHPDKGGNTEAMQLINTSLEEILKFFETNETLEIKDSSDEFINFDFIETLKKMNGVIIGVCGYWMWLTGNTLEHKDLIKELGFKFSGAKKSWYWSPTIDTAKFKRGSRSMKTIRTKYGSHIIENERAKILR
jgi:hypothetical protein